MKRYIVEVREDKEPSFDALINKNVNPGNVLAEILKDITAVENVLKPLKLSERKLARKVNYKTIRALTAIRRVLKDDTLNDEECIETIVCIFEEMGIKCGDRHFPAEYE